MDRLNNELFIEKYKQLEYVISQKYNLSKNDSPIAYIEKKSEYQKYYKKLQYCREVRNFLQHEEKINDDFAIVASDEMIKVIEDIIETVKNPVRCSQICIKANNVYCKTMNDYVMPSMLAMNHKKYTHIPLLEKDRVVGVFSKTSVFNFLLDEDVNRLTSSLRFNDISKYVDLNSECYIFSRFDSTVNEMENTLLDYYKKGKRVSMIFLTKNGKDNEKLLGIMTSFDVLGY